jgi:hypothetical protein
LLEKNPDWRQLAPMARRKKLSPEEMRKLIHSFRGKYKSKLGDKPFAEDWAEYKRTERELEERKFQRLAALGKKTVFHHEGR